MSLRLVPSSAHPTSTAQTTSAPSAPGVPDALRSRLGQTTSVSSSSGSGPQLSSTAAPTSTHPLEARLLAWRAQQETTRFNMLARQYGMAEPIRRRLELAAAAQGEWRPAVLGGAGRSFGSGYGAGSAATGSGVHADIMLGREAEVGWEDVFVDDPLRPVVDFHAEMEARVRMNAW